MLNPNRLACCSPQDRSRPGLDDFQLDLRPIPGQVKQPLRRDRADVAKFRARRRVSQVQPARNPLLLTEFDGEILWTREWTGNQDILWSQHTNPPNFFTGLGYRNFLIWRMLSMVFRNYMTYCMT